MRDCYADSTESLEIYRENKFVDFIRRERKKESQFHLLEFDCNFIIPYIYPQRESKTTRQFQILLIINFLLLENDRFKVLEKFCSFFK